MDSTTQIISIVILLLVLAANLILTQAIRRRRSDVPLRVIPAYEIMPMFVGEWIESDRPIHMSFGSSGLGGPDTLVTLVNAEFFYHVAQRTATGAVLPILTMSNSATLPLAQDTLRRAYAQRDRTDRYRYSGARWYPAGGESLVFAAALTATLGDDRVSGSVLGGAFGPELALVLDQANRRDQRSIATSSRLEGQAVAWAMSDHPLIGEEVFTAGAYLGDSASQRATVATLDLLRGLLILLILIPTANALTNGALFESITRLLGGGR